MAIFHVVDYHPYRKNGQINPDFKNSIESKKLLDVKDPTNTNHTAALRYYAGKLSTFLRRQGIDLTSFDVATVVPSSRANLYSTGLVGILNSVCNQGPPVVPGILIRHTAIQSMHSGGMRFPDVHHGSINVDRQLLPSNGRVLLLDDIVTTGVSLTACADILMYNGASEVVCIALGQTV